MRKMRCKSWRVPIRRSHPPPASRAATNSSTCVTARWPIWRPGCRHRPGLRAHRRHDGHRALRTAGRSAHATSTLCHRGTRLLDRRWRLVALSEHSARPFAAGLSEHRRRAYADACQLAESDRTLLLDVQRKVLTPLDLPDSVTVGERILDFQERYDRTAKPFRWKFTRQDLQDRLQALADTKSENF